MPLRTISSPICCLFFYVCFLYIMIESSRTILKGGCRGDHMEQKTQIKYLQIGNRLRFTKFLYVGIAFITLIVDTVFTICNI